MKRKVCVLGIVASLTLHAACRAQGIYSALTPPYTNAMAAAAAPVQAVNSLTGSVTVPGSLRATCQVTSFDVNGNGSCTLTSFTGGSAFTTMPDCIGQVTVGSSTYVYSGSIVTSSLTAPSVQLYAALKLLNISLGATTIWTTPPAGTTLTVVCRGN